MGLTQISTAGVKDDAVTASKVPADAVGASELADNAVDTAAIAADAVTGAKIADDAINSEHYTDGSIDTAHIADLNVTTAKIAADAITGAKIADDAIDSEHFVDGSIDTAHIATGQVTGAKLAAGAVSEASKIADSIITGAKIGSGTIEAGNLATNAITTAKITDGNVTLAKMASESVDEDNLQISNAGSNGQFLSKQSGNTGGLTWADAGGGGKILQVQGPVVSTTEYEITSSTYSDTDITDTITPAASSSKILVIFNLKTYADTNNYVWLGIKVIRTIGGSDTTVFHDDSYNSHSVSAHVNISYRRTIHVVDSPSTTSECTYKLQVARPQGTGSLYGPYLNGYDTSTYVGEEGSSILLMEIGA